MGTGFYLFIVHMATSDRPFLSLALFTDRNFSSGMVMVFCVSSVMLASGVLLAPYLQNLAGYPVDTAGWAMAPRGIGTMASMFLASRLGMMVDQRRIMAAGLLVLGVALFQMSTWTPDIPEAEMVLTLILQGFAMGLVFNLLSGGDGLHDPGSAFARRGDGHGLLSRNIGSAIGISVTSFTLTRGVQTTHADIAAGITPFDRVLQMGDPRTSRFARSGDAAWRGDAGSDDRSPGQDYCLQQRFSADDAVDRAAFAAAWVHAPTCAAGARGVTSLRLAPDPGWTRQRTTRKSAPWPRHQPNRRDRRSESRHRGNRWPGIARRRSGAVSRALHPPE